MKQLIKNFLKKLPGLRKLVFFFNEVRDLSSKVDRLTERLQHQEYLMQHQEYLMQHQEYLMQHQEYLMQLMREGYSKTKAEILSLYKACPFDKPRLAIYTALIGDYDVLPIPQVIEYGCDYYCFTDNPNLKSEFWEIVVVENEEGLDNVRFQRKIKLLPHLFLPQYEHSLYIDASILIRESVWDWVKRNTTGKPWLVYRHQDRNCVYEEAVACKQLNKDTYELIDEQIKRYRAEGYPEQNGMTWNAILYRKHMDTIVVSLSEAWFNELLKGSKRDQLSFNYICWKNNFEFDICEEDYRENFLWASVHDGKYI